MSDIPSSTADFTIYTLGIGTLSREFSTFTILHFSFHQVPITCRTPLHIADSKSPVIAFSPCSHIIDAHCKNVTKS